MREKEKTVEECTEMTGAQGQQRHAQYFNSLSQAIYTGEEGTGSFQCNYVQMPAAPPKEGGESIRQRSPTNVKLSFPGCGGPIRIPS